MTNLQIVINDAIASNIFTDEQIEAYLSEGDLPLKTFSEWKSAGFTVKRGQQACLKTRIWMPKRPKKESKPDSDSDSDNGFVLVPAHFFSAEQVVKYDKSQIG